jgi:hypothetical protein
MQSSLCLESRPLLLVIDFDAPLTKLTKHTSIYCICHHSPNFRSAFFKILKCSTFYMVFPIISNMQDGFLFGVSYVCVYATCDRTEPVFVKV